MSTRVCIVTSIVAPYRTPVFDLLASDSRITLRVLYLAESEPHRKWAPDWESMSHDGILLKDALVLKRHHSWVHVFARGLVKQLRAWGPDVVIAGGWDQIPHQTAYLLRKILGYKFLWWVESNARDSRVRGRLSARLKGRLARGADGVIVPGSASASYVMDLGVDTSRVFVAPNTVDHQFFRKSSAAQRGNNENTRYLFVGRLEPTKGVQVLLDAWYGMRDEAAELVIVGDGPLRGEVLSYVEQMDSRSVHWLGHLDMETLAREYAAADVFVFPSLSDPWGLVLNEAQSAGLPVITTSAPGAVDDLIHHGENGLVVDPNDSQQLLRAMKQLCADVGRRRQMRRESARTGTQFIPEVCARGIVDACRSVTGTSS